MELTLKFLFTALATFSENVRAFPHLNLELIHKGSYHSYFGKKKIYIYIYIYLKSKPDSSWNLEHPVAHATCFSMDSDTDRYVRQPHWVHHAYLLNLQPSLIYWKKALFKIISITSIKTRHENFLPFVTIWMELEGMMLSEIRGKTNTAWPHL